MSLWSIIRALGRIGLLLATVGLTVSNEPPSISNILDYTTMACTTLSIPFTVSDSETAPGRLLISASSGHTNLVRDTNMVLVGNGTNRTLTLFMTGYGVAEITISVSDGEAVASSSFKVSVFGCTRPPILFPIPDRSMRENRAVEIPLHSEFCDRCVTQSPIVWFARSDNTQLFPTANVSFLAYDTNATLVLTPATNEIGDARITVWVSDGTSTVAASFRVAVSPAYTGAVVLGGEGQTTISFTGSHVADLVLESSPDFRLWTPIQTNRGSSSLDFFTPATGTRFFRVQASK